MRRTYQRMYRRYVIPGLVCVGKFAEAMNASPIYIWATSYFDQTMLEDTTKDDIDNERNAKKRTGHNLMFTNMQGNANFECGGSLSTTPVLESVDVGTLGSKRSGAARSGKEEVKVLPNPRSFG